MNRYTVNVHYDAVIPVKVCAVSEEEALELAFSKANSVSLEDADICNISCCVTDVEELW